MSAPAVSLVVAARNAAESITDLLVRLSAHMQASGLEFEVIVVDEASSDATLAAAENRALFDRRIRTFSSGGVSGWKKGVQEARGDVICLLRENAPYRLRDLEYAVAMVEASSTDIVFGVVDFGRSLIQRDAVMQRSEDFWRRAARAILGCGPVGYASGLRVFSIHAAKLLFAEAKFKRGPALDFELLFLANKYGFRVDFLPNAIASADELERWQTSISTVRHALHIKQFDARDAYRAPRRCPICFSAAVRTIDQQNGHVIRECRRCKCKYLGSFPTEKEIERTRELRLYPAGPAEGDGASTPARDRTYRKRLKELRRLLPTNARILEVGAREGDLGAVLNTEFGYVGIELSDAAARAARRKGLEVYRSALGEFVNLGSSFDAVVMYEVFQHLPNPHEALSRVKDHLKSGGLLVIVTPDTESLMSFVAGKRWSAYKVPEHVILYSRSALIELLEHSGFEIVSAGADYRYVAHAQIRAMLDRWPPTVARVVAALLLVAPEPLFASSGSIRVVARRRSGAPVNLRPIQSVEPTHAN